MSGPGPRVLVTDADHGVLDIEEQVLAAAGHELRTARCRTPAEVVDAVDRAGLGYDPRSRTGATLHLLGALPEFGKMGVTCIADSLDDADALYRDLVTVLRG